MYAFSTVNRNFNDGQRFENLRSRGIANVRSKTFSLVIVQCKLKHLITIVRKSLGFFSTLPAPYNTILYDTRRTYQNVYNEVREKMAA